MECPVLFSEKKREENATNASSAEFAQSVLSVKETGPRIRMLPLDMSAGNIQTKIYFLGRLCFICNRRGTNST